MSDGSMGTYLRGPKQKPGFLNHPTTPRGPCPLIREVEPHSVTAEQNVLLPGLCLSPEQNLELGAPGI